MTLRVFPKRRFLLSALLAIFSVPAFAQPATFATSMEPVEVASSDFGNTSIRMVLNAADEPVVSFGKSGHLYVAKWDAGAQAFGVPTPIDSTEAIYLSDQEGPEMAAHGDLIVLTYSHSGDWTHGLRSVRSLDGGATWSEPLEVVPGATTDLFLPCVAMDDAGNPFIGVIAGGAGENKYEAAIQSLDGGLSWLPPLNSSDLMDGDQVCECCPSAPFFANGRYYNAIRNNNSNTRDFWIVGSDDGQDWSTALDIDPIDWVISSCPASGATAAGPMADGTHWFSFMNEDPVTGSSRIFLSQADLEANSNAGEWLSAHSVSPIPSESGIQNAPVMDVRQLGDGSPLAVLVWEENQAGYDVRMSLALNDASYLSETALNLTSEFSGHHKKPVVRLGSATSEAPFEIDVHLVWKAAQSGVVRYLKGTATGPDGVATFSPTPSLPSIAEVLPGTVRVDIPAPWSAAQWKVWDVSGKLLDSGSLSGSSQWVWGVPSGMPPVVIIGLEPTTNVAGWAKKVALR
jgi:hypothetical protein